MILTDEKNQETKVLDEIVADLNAKFDPNDLTFSAFKCPQMFNGFYMTQGNNSGWNISFLGIEVINGGTIHDGEKYIPLYEENKQKIFMLAVSKTVGIINDLVALLSMMNVSETNKKAWMEVLKKSLEEDK